MILGLGSDLCDSRRIEQSLARYGARLLNRCFTEGEQTRGALHANRAAFYARRFAVKEACAKALGTGFQQGVYFRDIDNSALTNGKPVIFLKGGALARLISLRPEGFLARLHVTISDELPLAYAHVMIEAQPEKFLRHYHLATADWI